MASDTRRQSGLWAQNPQTGYYDQQKSSALPEAPFQYYQPPTRRSEDEKRRSFSERAGNIDNYITTSDHVQRSDSKRVRDATRAATEMIAAGPLADLIGGGHGGRTSEQLAQTQHVNSISMPGSSHQPPLRIDTDYVPENIRTKPWSPDPLSPRSRKAIDERLRRDSEQKPAGVAVSPGGSGQPTNASESVRKGSVSDRSPLQKLEGKLDGISKEEKRIRMEALEQRARQHSLGHSKAMAGEGELLRSGTLRSEKKRVVSDGTGRTRESSSDQYYRDGPRRVSDGAPASAPDVASDKFRRATEALKSEKSAPVPDATGPSRQRSTRQHAPSANETRPYNHEFEPRPRDLGITNDRVTVTSPGDEKIGRPSREEHQDRLRDVGFAGAGTAIAGAGVAAYEMSAADRGRAAHEKRKALSTQRLPKAQASPIGPAGREGNLGRSVSNKVESRSTGTSNATDVKQLLQSERMASGQARGERQAAEAHQQPDPVPKAKVATEHHAAVQYQKPPQTAAGQLAREQVGFEGAGTETAAAQTDKHHRLGALFHKHGQEHRSFQPSALQLDEWRNAQIAKLTADDLDFDRETPAPGPTVATEGDRDAAWWEKGKSPRRASSSGSKQAATPNVVPAQFDGPYEEEAKAFRPALFLKCGPLLRYTGIRREGSPQPREIWRGSIMVVTEDSQSDYSTAPTLRIFAQPMDLHKPPPRELLESGQEIAPEDEDPLTGQVKISRTGRPLYVRPVHDIPDGVDLSREENNQGLYTATRPPVLGPQLSGAGEASEQKPNAQITFQDKSRVKRRDGEKAGRFKEVNAARLHAERGFTFWRFSIEIELGSIQHRVAYRINRGPALGFWVPARGETMNIMFHSCNGFSLSVDPNQFSGPDPLWRDALNRHQSRPFHVMIGGGDQIYNDAAMRDTTLFREWLQTKNAEHKHSADFTPEMQEELETFYLHRYSMWFSQGLFAMAASQVPMVNIWDDHDIIDGFGSYPHRFMATRVFTGLGAVAFKYYMLFQHQSVPTETEKEEPSWCLGASPGPYINQLSRSVFLDLGRKVKFLGLDCRIERMRDEILSQETYDIVFDRCRSEIVNGMTKHLIVLLGVPIAYPRLNFLENILTSRIMDPIKAIGRTGMLGGFVNKFDGGVEILDDLDDHWTAKHHKAERNWFIQELQELAAERSVRVTILGGDVHLGAVGQFYTPKRFGVSKDKDHRYMPNIISSAIVNTPPPTMMADVLNRRNKVHHLDHETDEDLIPMFEVDVDGSKRNNKCLLPRRNYCTIREFAPGHTPPPSPGPGPRSSLDRRPTGTPSSFFGGGEGGLGGARGDNGRRFPPGSMRRTMSLTRGPVALVRRLSGSSRSKNPPSSLAPERAKPYNSQAEGPAPEMGAPAPGMLRSNSLGAAPAGSYFPQGATAGAAERPTFAFHRRPTALNEREIRRAAAKGGAPDEDGDGRPPAGHVDLEHGLDISLNMEIDQHDASGATQHYRLLVPALWYEGAPDVNSSKIKRAGGSLMDRFRGRRSKSHANDAEDDYSRSPTPSPPPTRGQVQPGGGQVRQGGGSTVHMPPGVTRGPTQAAFGGSDDYDQRRATDPRPLAYHPAKAYDNGYNLSGPPIGSNQPQAPNQTTLNNPYPQSGSRAVDAQSGPTATKMSAARPAGQPVSAAGPRSPEEDEYTEGSLTPSEEYNPPGQTPGLPTRRFSKADRFFGMDEEREGRRSMQQDGGVYGDEEQMLRKKKAGWKIWK